jgi:putative two-component system response regulator
VSLADVLGVLSMKRPYKEPWPIEKILQHILDQSSPHVDPELVEVFKRVPPRLLEVQQNWQEASGNIPLPH